MQWEQSLLLCTWLKSCYEGNSMLLALLSTKTHCCLLFSFLSAGIFRPFFLQPCSPVRSLWWPGTILSYLQGLAAACTETLRSLPAPASAQVPEESIPVLQHVHCSPRLCAVHRLAHHALPATPWAVGMLILLATVPTPARGILHLWTQPFQPAGPASFPLALTPIYSGQGHHFPYKDTTGDFDAGQSQSRPYQHSEELSLHSHSYLSCQISQAFADQNGCSCLSKRLSSKIKY